MNPLRLLKNRIKRQNPPRSKSRAQCLEAAEPEDRDLVLRQVPEPCETFTDPQAGGKDSLGAVHDITEQHHGQAATQRQSELLALLVEISNTFINLPACQFDAELNRSLRRLGSFVKADRFFVFSYDFHKNIATNTHEWCEEGIEPMIDHLQASDVGELHQWVACHRQGLMMKVPSVQDLAGDDPLRALLEPQQIKTLITMPLMEGEACVGFIGLDYVQQQHDFNVWEEKLLSVFARMLANAKSRIRLLEEISQGEAFLNAVIENSPAVFYVKDPEGAYLRVNSKWTEISGLTRKETLGKTDSEIFHDGLRVRELRDETEKGGARHLEEMVRLGGECRQFYTIEFPVGGDTAQQPYTAGISTDVTEIKKLQAERQDRERAEAVIREKNLFLAKMSHEIRTPLNAILGFSRLLLQEIRHLPGPAEKMRVVQKNAEHLATMIDDMLGFARLDSHKMAVVPATFHLGCFFGDLAEDFRLRTEERGLRFQVEFHPHLQQEVSGDANKLRQILTNLLTNALKFTEEGSIALRAQPAAGDGGLWVRFEVEDSGCGIPAEEQSLLFQEYFQGVSGKKAGGTGLGLTIANHLAILMGGSGVSLCRSDQTGSLFAFSIPFEKVGDTQAWPSSTVNRSEPLRAKPGPHWTVTLHRLPPGKCKELSDLVAQGDMQTFREKLRSCPDIDAEAMTHLLRLASRYNYPALRALLEKEPQKMKGRNDCCRT